MNQPVPEAYKTLFEENSFLFELNQDEIDFFDKEIQIWDKKNEENKDLNDIQNSKKNNQLKKEKKFVKLRVKNSVIYDKNEKINTQVLYQKTNSSIFENFEAGKIQEQITEDEKETIWKKDLKQARKSLYKARIFKSEMYRLGLVIYDAMFDCLNQSKFVEKYRNNNFKKFCFQVIIEKKTVPISYDFQDNFLGCLLEIMRELWYFNPNKRINENFLNMLKVAFHE